MVLCSVWGWGQVTILSWDFTSDNNAITNLPGGTATVSSNGLTTGTSGCTGNGYSGSTWIIGDYIQILAPTTGYSIGELSLNIRSSNTGPAKLDVQYSSTGTSGSFTTIGQVTSTNSSTCATRTIDFSAITVLNNNPNVVIRLVGGNYGEADGNPSTGNPASTGTLRIDDIIITGIALPTCTPASTSFADGITVNKTTADAPFTNVFNSDNTSPEAYSSSDTNVATVNATTGEVTIVGVGSTTIDVTQIEDGTYCAVTDSYTLNVTSVTPFLIISGNANHGDVCPNTSAAVQTYTIDNTGGSAASGINVSSNNPQFVVSNLSATTISAGGQVTFDVTFTPSSAGAQSATITVNNANTPTIDLSGTGLTASDPTLTAHPATSVTDTEVTLNGDITSLGACLSNPLTEKGFVYGTSVNPEFNGGTFLTDGTAATGVFDATVTTLSPATTYYYKAYVVDGTGQNYFSNELSFTTILDAPVATAATNITPAGFTANWDAVTGADSYVLEVSEVSGSVTPNVTVVGWDFEDSNQTSDSGINANNNRLITTNSTGTIVYNVAGGNTSAAAISNSDWNGGADSKFWQISFATTGMSNLKLSSAQRSSNTGPRDFKVQYSLDGSSWNDVTLASITVANNWTTGVLNNVALPSACDNQALVYLRWIMTSNTSVNLGSVANTGTNSIDDIVINGDQGTFSSTPITGSPFTITAPATTSDVIGLNPDSNYTYSVKAVKGTVESAVSNTISVTTEPAPASTTYAGGSWTNGAPNSPDTDAVISENYNGVGFTAKDITVSSGAALTITSTETITAANITVEDNANFIQEDGSTLNLTGTMTLNKNATSDAAKYVFWSSPVQNQNVYDIYPAGTPEFVMTYDSDTDLYPIVANPTMAAAGVGYSVKVPVSATATQFIGAPNSGDVIVNLYHVANANGNAWNLIGNPYPSNLNLQSLYNGGGIGSSIYFWDNISATNTTQQQAATTWAVFNAAGGTWSSKGSLGIDDNSLVKPGQGFIVQATAPSITFTNAMRSAATANFINKGMNPGEGKFWLKLSTPAGTQFQTAITYGSGALNTLEAFDSKVMSVGANGIYSYLGADKLAIQGRDYFVNTDVVILGNKHSASGQYTFSLAGKTGLFDAGQAIYLKDKQTNIYTNLQTDSYTFLSDALEQQDRFEIVYQPQAALGTAETVKTETVVYKDGDHFTVKASEKILSIEVYDASGRHIGTVKPDSTTAQVTAGSRGMYLLKIKTVNSETVKKVIK